MTEEILYVLENWDFEKAKEVFNKYSNKTPLKNWIARKEEEKATPKLRYELEKLAGSGAVAKLSVEVLATESTEEIQKEVDENNGLSKDMQYVEDEYFQKLVAEQNSAWNYELKFRNELYDHIGKSTAKEAVEKVIAQREKRINLTQRLRIYKETGNKTKEDLSKATESLTPLEAQKQLTNSVRPKITRRYQKLEEAEAKVKMATTDAQKAKAETKKQEIQKDILILEAERDELEKIVKEAKDE
ncbi:hypothetical protein [Bernardetia sp.]|uniref:hypothetical protein n=1 Tax=Bernardetia sp. TaxID=1937974 RepID=UPI0025BE1104|nr:hypothetical protein [Bernardetia sp.]